MANIFRGKVTGNKSWQVSGYAVTRKGYTRSAQVTVEALNRNDAIIRATAQLRWEGLTHFKALKVLEITMSLLINQNR
ncbi:hypothetical protein IHA60_004377 [Salmonella enterica]|nr:hypothetical protein [Salmonella enterica]ECD0156096.1 hypothetical protein [Salmonella enterica subsp. enterica]ECD4438639.1 hypothetical protein [Salmonella enterica subsp. enterica serovar Florida]ECT3490067.1 hypothetical protein [Salmonella enterica subsp. enterica serovar Braenderup]EEG1557519.1 hypothetical protein [Salmonella enterica subsp. enterica serovar Midway]